MPHGDMAERVDDGLIGTNTACGGESSNTPGSIGFASSACAAKPAQSANKASSPVLLRIGVLSRLVPGCYETAAEQTRSA